MMLAAWASPDLVLVVLRLMLGGFFFLARFRFIFDPSRVSGQCWFPADREQSLRRKMCSCGWPAWLAKPVAWAEVLFGLLLVVGLFSSLSAVVLLVILIVASICVSAQKVLEQGPVDKLDCVACYLWRVEGLYIAIAAMLALNGGGAFSVDALL